MSDLIDNRFCDRCGVILHMHPSPGAEDRGCETAAATARAFLDRGEQMGHDIYDGLKYLSSRVLDPTDALLVSAGADLIEGLRDEVEALKRVRLTVPLMCVGPDGQPMRLVRWEHRALNPEWPPLFVLVPLESEGK